MPRFLYQPPPQIASNAAPRLSPVQLVATQGMSSRALRCSRRCRSTANREASWLRTDGLSISLNWSPKESMWGVRGRQLRLVSFQIYSVMHLLLIGRIAFSEHGLNVPANAASIAIGEFTEFIKCVRSCRSKGPYLMILIPI